MKRFLFWSGTGHVLNASCRDCDYRLEFELPADGGVLMEATNTHDCLRDEGAKK